MPLNPKPFSNGNGEYNSSDASPSGPRAWRGRSGARAAQSPRRKHAGLMVEGLGFGFRVQWLQV